jgi:hypothetical protein
MRLVAGCEGGNCPEVFVTDTGDVVVKGYTAAPQVRSRITFAAGEDAVAIPRWLLLKAAEEVHKA